MACFARTETNLDSDQSTLLAFKAQIRFDPQNILVKNWSTTTPVCNWIGISCGVRHKRVTALNLPNMSLNGTISPYLGNLSFLASLKLSNNTFHGHVPEELGHLRRLKEIDLGYNSLSGEVPSWFGILPKLEVLIMHYNSFTGVIPPSLGNITSLVVMRQLRVLSISGNPFNGILPVYIGNLSTSLYTLHASNCAIKGNIPNEISNLTNLAFVDLDHNDIDGLIPPTIKELWKLQILHLEQNRIPGSIPSGVCHLRNLGFLDLSKNEFSNSMPTCFENITSVRYLYLDSNKLTSSIPTSLWRLKDLLELNLSSNSLTGYISPEIGRLKVVTKIDLSRNRLSGIVPSTIVGLQGLSFLSLAHNRLQGPLPESLAKLVSLEFLDLSHNNISGTIPKSLEALLLLKYLNVSHNKLRGEIPNGGPFANLTYQSFLPNEDLCGPPRLLVPLCKSSSLKRSKKKRILLAAYISLAVGSTILALALIFFLIKQKRRSHVPHENDLLPAITHGRISYYELRRATHEFSEINLLGKGGFGSVYKGILTDGTHLAVKVFNLQLEGAFKCFDTECEVLRNLRHRNLTKVISSCSNLDFKAIVLEYMPNGSLEKWLYSHNYFLDIWQRLDIMIDVAHALDYLHHGYSSPVIHCDLKPSNVMLDEHMVAHVSDFGIAKLLGEESTALTKTLATLGYIAPEYGLEGLVSTRCDVYSYGIILMETFTRTNPCDEKFTGDLSLKNWVNDCPPNEIIQVIDANLVMLEDEYLTLKVQCVSSVLELALKCSTESPEERISMREVVEALQKIRLQLLEKCERP
ncbi:unnamed protein product [Ilex paraguariensis]|uniref:non-specific serine/threonine protein kinase n=1 Tax=Ilex paraguariensis TaxID=185542 RepID=A0ABC8RJE0_9AQUA